MQFYLLMGALWSFLEYLQKGNIYNLRCILQPKQLSEKLRAQKDFYREIMWWLLPLEKNMWVYIIGKKEKLPWGVRESALKALTLQGKTKQEVTQAIRRSQEVVKRWSTKLAISKDRCRKMDIVKPSNLSLTVYLWPEAKGEIQTFFAKCGI